jgi:hypothetical protein
VSGRAKSPSLLGLLARAIGQRLFPRLIRMDPEQQKAVKRDLAVAAGEDPAVFDTVEPLFERLLGEATGGRRDGPATIQPNWTGGERAVFTTRFIVEEFDSSGPLGLLATGLLDEARAGFRLLGLEEHAAAVETLLAAGFDADTTDDDPAVLDFAEDWYNLEDSDPARAAYIKAHPEEFRP